MRRILLFVFGLLLFASAGHAQVFHNALTLKPGQFSLGLNPVLHDEEFGMYFRGGYGLKKGIDLSVQFGLFDDRDNYFGADIEWGIFTPGRAYVSLVTGAHSWYDIGLDLGLNLTFPVRRDIFIFTGFDSDIEFFDTGDGNETELFGWIPIGVEVVLRSRLSMILECDVAVTDHAQNIFGGGVAFYF